MAAYDLAAKIARECADPERITPDIERRLGELLPLTYPAESMIADGTSSFRVGADLDSGANRTTPGDDVDVRGAAHFIEAQLS